MDGVVAFFSFALAYFLLHTYSDKVFGICDDFSKEKTTQAPYTTPGIIDGCTCPNERCFYGVTWREEGSLGAAACA